MLPAGWLLLLAVCCFCLAVVLNANRHVTGTLRGFDQFMNVVLDQTVDMKTKTDIGMVVSCSSCALVCLCEKGRGERDAGKQGLASTLLYDAAASMGFDLHLRISCRKLTRCCRRLYHGCWGR